MFIFPSQYEVALSSAQYGAGSMEIEEFAARHSLALRRDEIRHNVILAILKRAQNAADVRVRTWELGQPGCCAVQQEGYGIVLGEIDRQAARQLAHEVAGQCIPSVMGSPEAAGWFVEEARLLGTEYPKVIAQTIHVLDRQPVFPDCAGEVRLASITDVNLVLKWLKSFVCEAVPEDAPPTLEDATRRIDNNGVYLWRLDDQPVAMSCVGRRLEQGVAIAPVYTPPRFRCNGYAGAATAAIVDEVLKRNYRYACLFTDDGNPAANRCYAKIGFRPYSKAIVYRR